MNQIEIDQLLGLLRAINNQLSDIAYELRRLE